MTENNVFRTWKLPAASLLECLTIGRGTNTTSDDILHKQFHENASTCVPIIDITN